MPAPKKGVADYIAKKIAKKAVVKVKPKPNTAAMPKSNVKKITKKRTTAPKTGLENRGRKISTSDRASTATEMLWDKGEKAYDTQITIAATGMRSYLKGASSRMRGPGKKNLRKIENLKKATRSNATKKRVIKINSQQNLKKKSK